MRRVCTVTRPLARVLMTTDTVGGVFSYALELAHALSERNVELVLATMGPAPSPEQQRRARRIAGLILLVGPYRLEWMDDPWDDVAAAGRWLLQLERRFAPDLVHLNGYANGALPFAAPTLVVAHSCVLSWWQAVHGEPAPPRYATYREQVRLGLAGADCVVAPSRAMLRALERHYVLPGSDEMLSDARVLYNGTDLDRFSPGAKRPLIAAAGRVWDQAKNLASLARVASELSWPVHIAGDVKAPLASGEGQATADAPNVRRLGKLPPEQLASLLAEAAIFAAPAYYEPFGLSVLEAAASGCALVLGDIESQRELWSDAALFVRPDDAPSLVATLRRLIDDAGLRRALGSRALQRAADFSQARFGAQYAALYRELVERSRQGVRRPYDAALS